MPSADDFTGSQDLFEIDERLSFRIIRAPQPQPPQPTREETDDESESD